MPRLRIATEFEEYLIPWMHIALVKSDRSRKLIEIHTTLGLIFSITSRQSQNHLYALLQLERVKVIYPINGVTIKIQKVEL